MFRYKVPDVSLHRLSIVLALSWTCPCGSLQSKGELSDTRRGLWDTSEHPGGKHVVSGGSHAHVTNNIRNTSAYLERKHHKHTRSRGEHQGDTRFESSFVGFMWKRLEFVAGYVWSLGMATQPGSSAASPLIARIPREDDAVASPMEWASLVIFMCGCFVLDYFLCSGFWGNIATLLIWFGVAAMFGVAVQMVYGPHIALEWMDGYLLEWLLSFDNLFMFVTVFKLYKTPETLQSIALAWWIPVAVLNRLITFLLLDTVMAMFSFMKVVLGLFFLYSAYMAATVDDDLDVAEIGLVRLFHYCFGDRILDYYDVKKSKLFVWEEGRCCATLLVLVVFIIWVLDFLFSFDSVGGKVAFVPDVYIACSSSMLAFFGMRAFVVFLDEILHAFEMFKYGIAGVLAFVGLELIFSGKYELPPLVNIEVLLVILASSLIASYVVGGPQEANEDDKICTTS